MPHDSLIARCCPLYPTRPEQWIYDEGEDCYSMYTKPWEKKYSTNYGQYRGSNYYSVSSSYGYTLNPQDPGKITSAAV